MSRLSCVETVESDDGCGCCTIATTPLGYVSRYKYILVYHGERFVGEVTVTSLIDQDDADYNAYVAAKASALRQAGIQAWITEDEYQLCDGSNFSLAI